MSSKKTILITIIGVFIGLIVGYLYYYYIGCSTGNCPITSRPLNASLYGGLMGGLLFNMFTSKKTK